VVQAAKAANVPLDDYDRATLLGQVAELLSRHPDFGRRIAFKGGAIMRLVDGSPRLSRDLDGVLISGRPIRAQAVRAALDTPEARQIVVSVGKFVQEGRTGLRFPVIVCHPISGVGNVELSLSINWKHPLLLDAVLEEVVIRGRRVTLLTVARPERAAEKVRAFVVRGLDRDAFDLYEYARKTLTVDDWRLLPGLVSRKIEEDSAVEHGSRPQAAFDRKLAALETGWSERRTLVLTAGKPSWGDLQTSILRFRSLVPEKKG
jgi:predicted nucleotidyltransferase component of viral defense system